jgi:L-lactate dehydrogenase
VINKKGATFYAIGLVIAKIVRAILTDQSRVLSVSHKSSFANDICLSLPTIVRKSGICETLPIVLDDNEKKLFEASVEKVSTAVRKAEELL